MMAEELGLAGEVLNPYVAALVMGVAFALGGIVPVISYFWSEGTVALVTSVGLTAVGLFGVGCWRGALANSSWLRKGLEMVGLGGLSFFPFLWNRLAARRLDLSVECVGDPLGDIERLERAQGQPLPPIIERDEFD